MHLHFNRTSTLTMTDAAPYLDVPLTNTVRAPAGALVYIDCTITAHDDLFLVITPRPDQAQLSVRYNHAASGTVYASPPVTTEYLAPLEGSQQSIAGSSYAGFAGGQGSIATRI
jgi:hypothetical protein